MADLASMKFPVFLPGNNRDWTEVDGWARITDSGEVVVTVGPDSAKRLVDMAKRNILLQLSFDYRMSAETTKKINTQNQGFPDG